ncbi:glycosyltransferase family 4 protein [Sphingomonas sp. 1P06PA]|uniref:glycosyltransferase family 4 protein n=1 Tax=Sphingomonas sp. 1P06PA TaxID=554121 RepID=UPI0039A47391
MIGTAAARFDAVEFNNMVTPYTDRLFSAINRDGLRMGVVSCSQQEPNRDWAEAVRPDYDHVVLPGRSFLVGPRRYAHINSGIIRTLNHVRPRVLVLTGLYPSMMVGYAWARATRTPILFRADGGRRDAPMSGYHRIVRPMMLGGAAAALACGTKGHDFYLEQGLSEDRIFTMPLVPAWDAPPTVPGFDGRRFDVLWVAEMNDAVKNSGFFAEVISALKSQRPELAVRLVGRGRDAGAMLSRLSAAGIDYVHEETVPPAGMAEVFMSARLMFLPSQREPWGLVVNEAMQCGTPCIVSPFVGAADDLVLNGANGLVQPLDAAAWAAAAERLLDDPERWQMLSTAARTAVAERSLGRSAAIYADAIRYAAGSARTTRFV